MKFAVYFILILSVFSSELALPNKVELHQAFSTSMSRYGSSWQNRTYTVAVENVSPNKKVFIHHKKVGGSWVDIPMYFLTSSGNNMELWRTYTSNMELADEFVIKMEANNQTHWDNNDNNNYHFKSNGYVLGKSRMVSLDNWTISDSYPRGERKRFYANVILENVAPVKDVKLIYTLDNWSTTTTVNANYSGNPVWYGYGSYPNPSEDGSEAWHVSFEFPSSEEGEFYLSYNVAGSTFYDSNYGKNYVLNPSSHYTTMHLRYSRYWNSAIPMRLIDKNLWAGNVNFYPLPSNPNEVTFFKFDVSGDWQHNFGDNNADGQTELNGDNIALPEFGNYQILFNDASKEYFIQKFGL